MSSASSMASISRLVHKQGCGPAFGISTHKHSGLSLRRNPFYLGTRTGLSVSASLKRVDADNDGWGVHLGKGTPSLLLHRSRSGLCRSSKISTRRWTLTFEVMFRHVKCPANTVLGKISRIVMKVYEHESQDKVIG